MRLAKASLTLLTLATTAAIAPAGAQVVQPLTMPAPLPPLAASAPADGPKGLTSAAVEAVPMGNPSRSPAKAAGTMRELEELQRQTALAEMRKRLADLGQQTAAANVAPAVPAAAVSAAPGIVLPGQAPKAPARRATLTGNGVALPEPALSQPPRARVVNMLVVAGRARADVLEDGRLFTVKEGDALSDKWTVSSITPEGVMVERRKRVGAMPSRRDTMVASLPGTADLLGAPSSSAQREVVKLEPVSQSDLSQALMSSTATPASASPTPGIPPLPAQVRSSNKPDSTTTAVIPPLPASSGL